MLAYHNLAVIFMFWQSYTADLITVQKTQHLSFKQ